MEKKIFNINYVLALTLFFSVASIILQPSYQDSHQISGVVEFPIELCPVSTGVYYNDWTTYGSPPSKATALCDKVNGIFNTATGMERISEKKYQDKKYPSVPIPNSDIISVAKVTVKAQAFNTGSSDNKLDFMLFTGTKSTDWLTLHTFFPIGTSGFTTYEWPMIINPRTNNLWLISEVKTWVSAGKTIAFGDNAQIKQNSGKIRIGTQTLTVGINADATLSFNAERYASDGVDPVILTLDGPANLGSVTVNLHSRDANANLSVILSETSPGSGIYTNEITVGSSASPTRLQVSLDGDRISMSFLTLTVYADVPPAGTALAGYLGSPGSSTLKVRWHETREYSMIQGASIDVNDPLVPIPPAVGGSNTVQVTAKSYSNDARTTELASRTLTATRVGTTSTFTTSPLLAFSPSPSTSANVLQVRAGGGPITVFYGSDFDYAQVFDDTVTVPIPGSSYTPDNTIRQRCSQLGGDSDSDGICNNEETPSGLKVPLASGCTTDGAGVSTCTYIDNNDGPSGGADGIPNGGPDGVPDFYWQLPCDPTKTYANNPFGDQVCPNVNKKDVFIMENHMKFHKLSDTAWIHVITAFANSGVPNVGGATNGILLHIIPGVQIPHIDTLYFADPLNIHPDLTYVELKNLYFLSTTERVSSVPSGFGGSLADYLKKVTEAKRQIIKHMISGHFNGELVGSTGYSDRPGDDFIVTLGTGAFDVGSISQQERTIMHESGHTLGLYHACGLINGAPNCPSVMNYAYQFITGDGGVAPANSPLDYSPYTYSAIPENVLSDQFKVSHGLSSANARTLVVGGCTTCTSITTPVASPVAIAPRYPNTGSTFDWNNSGGALTAATVTYPFNLHYYAPSGTGSVPGLQDTLVVSIPTAIREWSALSYSHVGSSGFDLGVVNIQGNDAGNTGTSCGPLDPETLAFEVDAGPAQDIFEGELYSLAGAITDPHWTGNIDVRVINGDGTPDYTTTSPAGSLGFPDHPYDTVGTYTVTLSADKDISQPSCVSGEQPFTYHISASDTTTVNVNPKGHIKVDKVTDPSGDTTSFSFDASGGSYTDFSLTDTSVPNDQKLVPGTYSVAETVPAGWDQASATCSSTDITDSSSPGAISLQGGETITCTFTNTKRGHIIVDKVTEPSGSATSFSFSTTSAGYTGFSLTDAATPNDQELVPGTYSVAETVPAGWYQTSATCSDGSALSAIILSPGETVTCTFANANLVVVYQGPAVEANKYGQRNLPLQFTVTAGIGGPIITTQTPQVYTIDSANVRHPSTGFYDPTLSDTGVYQVQLDLQPYPNGLTTAYTVLDNGSEWPITFTIQH